MPPISLKLFLVGFSLMVSRLYRSGYVPVAIGLILGITVAFALTRVLRAFLFQTSATDVLTFVGISAILTSVSLLACYIPVRRALKVDPMQRYGTNDLHER